MVTKSERKTGMRLEEAAQAWQIAGLYPICIVHNSFELIALTSQTASPPLQVDEYSTLKAPNTLVRHSLGLTNSPKRVPSTSPTPMSQGNQPDSLIKADMLS
jgi:hypothetical protein